MAFNIVYYLGQSFTNVFQFIVLYRLPLILTGPFFRENWTITIQNVLVSVSSPFIPLVKTHSISNHSYLYVQKERPTKEPDSLCPSKTH